MVTELGDGVWQIELGGVNAYLADDEGDLTLVDAGMPWHANAVLSAIEAAGHHASDLDRVLLTHYDVDHVGTLGRLGSGAPVYIGSGDAAYLAGEASPPLSNHKGLLQRVVGPLARIGGSPVDVHPLADGDAVGSFTAYHVPGHTPGHTAYVSEALDVAFVGDLVSESDGRLEPSPWVISYDREQVVESIHDLADRAPAVEILAMGHGTPFVREGSVRLAELGERLERGAARSAD